MNDTLTQNWRQNSLKVEGGNLCTTKGIHISTNIPPQLINSPLLPPPTLIYAFYDTPHMHKLKTSLDSLLKSTPRTRKKILAFCTARIVIRYHHVIPQRRTATVCGRCQKQLCEHLREVELADQKVRSPNTKLRLMVHNALYVIFVRVTPRH